MAEAESGAFAPLRGASHLLCSCKETWPKEALFNSRMAGQHAPASAPSVPAALRVHTAAGIFRRDPAAMQLGPGQSPHGASPLTGAKRCFACFRFAPVSSKNDVLARFAVESGAGAQPHGTCPSGGAKQCFAYFRRTHARLPCGVLSVGSVAAEGDPKVKCKGKNRITATPTTTGVRLTCPKKKSRLRGSSRCIVRHARSGLIGLTHRQRRLLRCHP